MPATETRNHLTCGKCKAEVDLTGKRVGDSARCGACGALEVVTRSKVRGDVPPATRVGGMTAHEREEVQEALRRVKLRRVGQAARHQRLYPNWAVFLAGVQFYLSGILAGQNLAATGDPRRGQRLMITGVVSYVVIGVAFLVLAFTVRHHVPNWLGLTALGAVPLGFATWFTFAQQRACAAARDAGAQNAPVLLPLLLGLILAIAQAFAVWFLWLRLEGPF